VREGRSHDTSPPNHLIVTLNPTYHFIRRGEDGTADDLVSDVVLIAHIDDATNTVVLHIEHIRNECQ
jgi:hypothetical protein